MIFRAGRNLLVLITAIAAVSLLVACSDGGDDQEGGDSSNASRTAGVTPGSASAGVDGTASGGSPTSDGTPRPRTPSGAGETPITGGGGTSGTPGSVSTPSAFEATFAAEAGGDIAGGDPGQPREPVGDIPTPPPGAEVDDEEIAPPNPDQAGLQLIVDMDATTAGIQSSRNVQVGDVFRVAIVAANLPADGISAFNFNVDYDKTKVVAPSYTGGPGTDRNPDLNNAALGDGWTCLPAPEGDVDDPGGINGDGNPATGSALLSCFVLNPAPGGTQVLATIEFHAVATGSTSLNLHNLAVTAGGAFVTIARCPDDPEQVGGDAVPCTPGNVTVQ